MIRLVNFLLAAALLIGQNTLCKGAHIKTISSADGLTNNAIYSLHQDKYGHVWIGTGDGLNIWDGNSLEVFKSNDGQNYFFGNRTRNIIPYKGDEILIQTKYGVAELNTVTKDIRFYKELSLHTKIAITDDGNIFTLNKNHIDYFLTETSTFSELRDFRLIKNEKCQFMTVSSNDLYVFTDNGSYRLRLDFTNESTPIVSEIFNLSMNCLFVSPIQHDTDEHYIITKDGAIWSFNVKTNQFQEITRIEDSWAKENRITGIVRTDKGFYISFIEDGVHFLPSEDKNLKPIGINCGIFSMMKDRSQPIIWIGTDCNGLQLYSEETSEIWDLTYEDLPYEIKMPVRSILMDKNKNLWFGTKGDGLYRIRNFDTKSTFNKENTDRFNTTNTSLLHNSVYALTESRSNLIWIGTDGKGLNWYSYRDNRIREVKGSKNLKRVHCILEQNENTLWVATDCEGAYKCHYEIINGSPVITMTDTLEFCEPFNYETSIFSIAIQNDSTLWFGSRSYGALSYNTKTGQSKILQFPSDRGVGINEVTDIVNGEQILFATGNGMAIYSTDNDSLQTSPEVPARTVHSIIKDKNENIWLSTNQGIISLDKEYDYRTSYNRFSRLRVLEYSDGAAYDDGDNIFFGGINGLTMIQADSNTGGYNNTYNPPIHITEFIQNNTATDIGSKLKKGKLRIPFSKQIFAIRYSVVDNINFSDYVFLWNIKRNDNEWRENTSETIYIPTLNSGEYVLRVKYINKATRYESAVCELPIYIIPPIYKRWWALLIYALLIITGIIALIRYAKSKQRDLIANLEKQYEEAVHKTKSETVNSITEELSVLITFILGLSTQVRQDAGSNNIVKEKLSLLEYNIIKINNILNILKDSKDLSDQIDTPKEMLLLPVSQLTLNLLDILNIAIKSKKARLLYDIEEGIILTTNKDYYQTLFNSLMHKVLSIISGEREIYVSLKRKNNDKGVSLTIKVTAEEADCQELYSDKNGTNLHSKLIDKMDGNIVYAYENGSVRISIFLPHHKSVKEITNESKRITENIDTNDIISANHIPEEFEISPGREYIFIIGTNKEISSFIGYFLSEKYNIMQLQDNEEAFKCMESLLPAAVIYDYSSLRSGFPEYIENIRSNKRSRHISVIAMTSSIQMNERKECTKLGADLCLSFPFNVEYLQAVLEKLIDKREKIAEYFNSPISSYEKKDGKIIHQEDKAFYQKILDIINNHISNPELSASLIAKELGISIRVMYRKLENINTPNLNQLIIDTRMKLAVKYLTKSKMTIDEVLYKVGYENRSTFYRNFKNSYGMTPKEYREQIQNKTLEEFN